MTELQKVCASFFVSGVVLYTVARAIWDGYRPAPAMALGFTLAVFSFAVGSLATIWGW